MKVGQQGADYLEELFEYANNEMRELNGFEQQFVERFKRKLKNWGEDAFISDGEIMVINQVAETLGIDKFERSWLED